MIDLGGMQGVGTELRERMPSLSALLPGWFRTRNLMDQRTYHDRHLKRLGWEVAALRQRRAERWFGGGGSDDAVSQEMQEAFLKRFQRLVCNIRVAGNPYAAHLLLGDYPPNARPFYLTRKGLSQAKRSGHVTFVVGDIIHVVASLPADYLDAADLSNVTDLLPMEETRRLFDVLAVALRLGGRVVHRNLVWDAPPPVVPPFRRDHDMSRTLLLQDRSFVYSAVTLDVLEP